MNQAFLDYFRCPESFVDFRLADEASRGSHRGYFKFGPELTCYGASGVERNGYTPISAPDMLDQVRVEGSACVLPFNPTEVADNLRYERYVDKSPAPAWKRAVRQTYYAVRPALPVSVRHHLQKQWLKGWDTKPFPRWPVDRTVDQMFQTLMRFVIQSAPDGRIPFIWFWPEGKSSSAVMTHDVETSAGLMFSRELMDINDSFGIKSSFQIIPDARYVADQATRSAIHDRGFEVNVHDLKHDGHLFDNLPQFVQSAARINEFVSQFGSKGYRSGVLYRNLEWYDAFKFSYDMSVPNVAHLDPQPGGCCTVMPYFVGDILEIPVTTTQDYSLFHVLGTYSQDLWQQQVAMIMEQNGMASFIVHPDYIQTAEAKKSYCELLAHLSGLRDDAGLWIALPREVDSWWRQRSKMRLEWRENKGWCIEGEGSERARIAYATIYRDTVSYEIA